MKLQQPSLFTKVIIVLFISSFAACGNDSSGTPASDAQKPEEAIPAKELVFDKLLGTWANEDGKSFERWTKKEDGTYQSVVFSIKGTDTSWNEQASIYPENDKWIFENTVKGQNDGKAVKFTSSQLTEKVVQFSNPDHDFPTDINYTVSDANTLNAFIIGPNDKGGKDTIPFNSRRIK